MLKNIQYLILRLIIGYSDEGSRVNHKDIYWINGTEYNPEIYAWIYSQLVFIKFANVTWWRKNGAGTTGYQYRKKIDLSLILQRISSDKLVKFRNSMFWGFMRHLQSKRYIITYCNSHNISQSFFWIQEAAYSTSEDAISTHLLDITNVHIHLCTLLMEEILKYYKSLLTNDLLSWQ